MKKTSLVKDKLKGISFHKRDQIYVASVRMNGKKVHVGNFDNELEAILTYNIFASFVFN